MTTEPTWINIVIVVWLIVMSTAALVGFAGLIGFRMGRMTQDESVKFFPEIGRKTKPFEDPPGGAFDDHAPGGLYDQIEQAEQIERMQTT